jgi:hypothetical protein
VAESAARDRERTVPIKVLGHWENAGVHTHRGDLFIDIPAELVRLVEADHPGRGEKFGYQLLVERVRIAEFFRDDLDWLDEARSVSSAARRPRFKRVRFPDANRTLGMTVTFGGPFHLLRAWLYLGKQHLAVEVRR